MKLSIVIIGRNDAQHIARSIGTAIDTRTDGVEVVFVDDASTDATLSTARKICEGKPDTKVIHSDVNVGIGGARNLGVEAATGDYIYFHDSDDYLTEDGIKRIVDVIARGASPDVILVPYRVLRAGGHSDHSPEVYTMIYSIVGWAVGAWSAAFKRSLYVKTPENVYAEDVVWHYLQYDKFETYDKVTGKAPVYVWDCTNPNAVTRTVEWFWNRSMTLEHLAFSNILVKEGLKDSYVSDSLRNLASLYDVRHELKKPWVRDAWARRFRSCCQRIMAGHFGH